MLKISLTALILLSASTAQADYLDVGSSATGKNTASISFNANDGYQYHIKWKLSSAAFFSNANAVDVTPGQSGFPPATSGRSSVNIGALTCGQNYNVHVRRKGRLWRTSAFSTYAC